MNGATENLGVITNEISDNFISTNVNWLFDRILRAYKDQLIIRGKTEIPIQNFEEDFSYKITVLTIEGHMSVSNGSVKNLTSLERTGDVTLDKNGNNITLTVPLGMTDFHVKYNQYELELMGLTQSGSIQATVGTNSVSLKILIVMKPKCEVQLKSLELVELGDIDIDVTGLGPMNGLIDDISSWIVTHISHSYKNEIQNLIFDAMNQAIQDFDLCHYF